VNTEKRAPKYRARYIEGNSRNKTEIYSTT